MNDTQNTKLHTKENLLVSNLQCPTVLISLFIDKLYIFHNDYFLMQCRYITKYFRSCLYYLLIQSSYFSDTSFCILIQSRNLSEYSFKGHSESTLLKSPAPWFRAPRWVPSSLRDETCRRLLRRSYLLPKFIGRLIMIVYGRSWESYYP